jgi:beta-lactam-binding protein with PASTA domain
MKSIRTQLGGSLALMFVLGGVPLMTGCDKTKDEKDVTVTHPDGSTQTEAAKTIQKPDGSVETKTETSTSKPATP